MRLIGHLKSWDWNDVLKRNFLNPFSILGLEEKWVYLESDEDWSFRVLVLFESFFRTLVCWRQMVALFREDCGLGCGQRFIGDHLRNKVDAGGIRECHRRSTEAHSSLESERLKDLKRKKVEGWRMGLISQLSSWWGCWGWFLSKAPVFSLQFITILPVSRRKGEINRGTLLSIKPINPLLPHFNLLGKS